MSADAIDRRTNASTGTPAGSVSAHAADGEGRPLRARRGSATCAALAAVALVAGSLAAELRAQDAEAGAFRPRTPQRGTWTWDQPKAGITEKGDLTWKPEPFVFGAGASARYIDFEQGDDGRDGTSRDAAWKHHPWDPNATGSAKACRGVHAYVFKRGTVYRGTLRASESGEPGNPIRLTSDPAWGQGEAVIAGSERVSEWKQGATNADIPESAKVWYADVGFLPRNVWEVRDGAILRIPLARTPDWKVSDPEDVLSEWWSWEQPEWWTDKWCINTPNGRRHMGIDRKHLTRTADFYVGATLRTEYGIVMGTPYPTRVEAFDEKQKGLVFEGIYFNDSQKILTGNRYYLEDKPHYLDTAGEFWFERKGDGGRLFLRLPDDRDPNAATVEVARHINLVEDPAAAACPERIDWMKPEQLARLEQAGVSNLHISGLTFRFANTHWDLTLPAWGHKDVAGACIRLLGSGRGNRITHCRFQHVNRAIRVEPLYNSGRVEDILVADNEMEFLDHGALRIGEGGIKGSEPSGPRRLVDAKVLRNRLFMVGMRQPRQDHDFSLHVDNAETAEIAGNVLQRTYGPGIFVMRGKDLGGANLRDVPLARTLVYNNRVVESLLTANDWGGIEVNGGGAAYVYNNISGNANGYWNWAVKKDRPNSARLGMAYYLDGGGSKTYLFNNVAWGLTRDVTSRLCNHCAYYEAGANVLNTFANNTSYRFGMGSNWSPAGGRHMSLGNVWAEFGTWVWLHGRVKEDKGPAPTGEYPLFGDAYGRNVFCDVSPELAVIEASGRKHADVASLNRALVEHGSLSLDAGIAAAGSPFRDGPAHDFRPAPSSAVIDRGVKVFVPWALSRTVGEWHFRRNNADPTTLLDDHFYAAPYVTDRVAYTRSLLLNLKAVNVQAADFTAGPLEDWTDGALRFNGTNQFAFMSHAEMTRPYTCEVTVGKENKSLTFAGKELATPDLDTQNLLVEVYFRAKAAPASPAGAPAQVLVSKRQPAGSGSGDTSGYELSLNAAGGVTFTLLSAGTASGVESRVRVNDGAWHHVLTEADRAARTLVIYVDGTKAAEGPLALAPEASLSNAGDLLVGKGPDGRHFAGELEFLRIARGTLADARTTIGELYDWEFAGPFLRDFAGREPAGKARDAGAFEFAP